MVYKVNRIGTPNFYESKTVLQQAPPANWAGWVSTPLTSFNKQVVYPDPTAFQQFGTVKAYVAGTADLPANNMVSIGQCFTCPEVISGNAIGLELTCSIRGLMPADALITHSFGQFSTAPITPWDVESLGFATVLAQSDSEKVNTGNGFRAFNDRSVVLFHQDQPTIQSQLLGHSVDVQSASGSAATGIGRWEVMLGFRSILNGRELEYYDPVR